MHIEKNYIAGDLNLPLNVSPNWIYGVCVFLLGAFSFLFC